MVEFGSMRAEMENHWQEMYGISSTRLHHLWNTLKYFQAAKTGVTGNLTCFNCENLPNSHDCKRFTTCSDGQLCYKELTLVASGHYTHNKGCTPKELCDLSGASIKRSGLQVCFQCCDHHFCNFENCQKDFCLSNPCRNNATCVNMELHFKCTCQPGYTGEQCATDINECSSSPCVNGQCEDMVNAFVCHCNRGYTGQHCEKEVDECASSPCQHGGVCVDLVGEYGCGCKAGFQGVNCETDIDECTSNPCQNHGTCVDKTNGYNCSCPPGLSGIHCQLDINECASDPCHNGGKCVDNVNGYSCLCDMGFGGSNCERELGRRCYTCENVSHAGNCTDRTICKAEEKCYIQHELVSAGVFSFNLGCVPETLCSMMETLGGKRSSHSIQLCYECCDKNDCNRHACANSQFAEECFEHHCLHNGTCIARNGKPSCKCPDGFRGEHCEIDTPLICYGCAYTANHASCNFLRSCQWGSACFIGRIHADRVINMGCMEELACYDADKATHEGKLYTSHGTDFELATCCTDNKCNSHLV